jgi:predicted nucleotidyltransferase
MSRVHRSDPAVQEQMVAVLSSELATRSEVAFALMHGSFLTGQGGFRDVDVAVWLDHGADRWADITLSADLSRLIGIPVDVRIANAAPVTFLFHMLRGRILALRDERLLADVMERTARQYHDQAPLILRATRDAFAA